MTDSYFDTVSILYTIASISVLWRLIKHWQVFWDDTVTYDDQKQADAIALFLLIPIGVFFHELGHAIATVQMGGEVLEFQWRIFWGYVRPGGEFTYNQRWWLAFSGNLVSIVLGAIAFPLAQMIKKPILKVVLRSFGRLELVFAVVIYPLFSFLSQRGDWLMIYDFRARPYPHITAIFHLCFLILLWRFNDQLTQSGVNAAAAPDAALLTRSPARYYRKKIRAGLSVGFSDLPPSSDTEAALEPFLQSLYERQAQKLARHLPSTSAATIESETFAMFVFASGLFAFGHLDKATDILDNLPTDSMVQQLALVIPALLPLPPEMDPLTQPLAILEWIDQHRDRLAWAPQEERFILASDTEISTNTEVS